MSGDVLKYNWPDKSLLSTSAFGIIETLRRKGYEAFVAGGAVRDLLLKRPIREIDIATSAKPQDVEKIFPKTIPTGKKHGTVTVRQKGFNFEVTTFRVEGPYEKARRPTKVKFIRSAEEDAKRRDFTINAMFYDADKKLVLDYVRGIADLAHRRINLVGDPEKRIKEDALRMLRAVRFAATLRFDLSRETRRAIQVNAKLITKISGERVKQELDRIIVSDRASIGFGLLDVVGLLPHILPELDNLQGITQPKNQHSEGDVYAHSLLALENTDETYDEATRYAVLFHDLGKPLTKEVSAGKTTFYDHQAVGAEIAQKICSRLKFSSADTAKIAWLVKNHMVPHDFAQMKLSTRRKWGLNPYFSDLLRVYTADARAAIPASGRVNKNPQGLKEGLQILQEVKNTPALRKPLLSGKDVMKVLQIEPGPRVGKVLAFLEEKKLAGELATAAAALTFLKKNKKFLKNL
jgi:putative nucleotidyltransferase with HDIG domain